MGSCCSISPTGDVINGPPHGRGRGEAAAGGVSDAVTPVERRPSRSRRVVRPEAGGGGGDASSTSSNKEGAGDNSDDDDDDAPPRVGDTPIAIAARKLRKKRMAVEAALREKSQSAANLHAVANASKDKKDVESNADDKHDDDDDDANNTARGGVGAILSPTPPSGSGGDEARQGSVSRLSSVLAATTTTAKSSGVGVGGGGLMNSMNTAERRPQSARAGVDGDEPSHPQNAHVKVVPIEAALLTGGAATTNNKNPTNSNADKVASPSAAAGLGDASLNNTTTTTVGSPTAHRHDPHQPREEGQDDIIVAQLDPRRGRTTATEFGVDPPEGVSNDEDSSRRVTVTMGKLDLMLGSDNNSGGSGGKKGAKKAKQSVGQPVEEAAEGALDDGPSARVLFPTMPSTSPKGYKGVTGGEQEGKGTVRPPSATAAKWGLTGTKVRNPLVKPAGDEEEEVGTDEEAHSDAGPRVIIPLVATTNKNAKRKPSVKASPADAAEVSDDSASSSHRVVIPTLAAPQGKEGAALPSLATPTTPAIRSDHVPGGLLPSLRPLSANIQQVQHTGAGGGGRGSISATSPSPPPPQSPTPTTRMTQQGSPRVLSATERSAVAVQGTLAKTAAAIQQLKEKRMAATPPLAPGGVGGVGQPANKVTFISDSNNTTTASIAPLGKPPAVAAQPPLFKVESDDDDDDFGDLSTFSNRHQQQQHHYDGAATNRNASPKSAAEVAAHRRSLMAEVVACAAEGDVVGLMDIVSAKGKEALHMRDYSAGGPNSMIVHGLRPSLDARMGGGGADDDDDHNADADEVPAEASNVPASVSRIGSRLTAQLLIEVGGGEGSSRAKGRRNNANNAKARADDDGIIDDDDATSNVNDDSDLESIETGATDDDDDDETTGATSQSATYGAKAGPLRRQDTAQPAMMAAGGVGISSRPPSATVSGQRPPIGSHGATTPIVAGRVIGGSSTTTPTISGAPQSRPPSASVQETLARMAAQKSRHSDGGMMMGGGGGGGGGDLSYLPSISGPNTSSSRPSSAARSDAGNRPRTPSTVGLLSPNTVTPPNSAAYKGGMGGGGSPTPIALVGGGARGATPTSPQTVWFGGSGSTAGGLPTKTNMASSNNMLLSYNQSVHAPFHAAARNGHTDVLAYLAKQGTNTDGGGASNAANPQRRESSAAAGGKSNTTTTTSVIGVGTINEVINGRAPIHEAILGGHHRCVYEMLQTYGAAVSYAGCVMVRQSSLPRGMAAWEAYNNGSSSSATNANGATNPPPSSGSWCVPLRVKDPQGVLPSHATTSVDGDDGDDEGVKRYPLQHVQYVIICDVCRGRCGDGYGVRGGVGDMGPLTAVEQLTTDGHLAGLMSPLALETPTAATSNKTAGARRPSPHTTVISNRPNSCSLRRVDGGIGGDHHDDGSSSYRTDTNDFSAPKGLVLRRVDDQAKKANADPNPNRPLAFHRIRGGTIATNDEDGSSSSEDDDDDPANDPIVPAYCPMCCVEEQPLHLAASIGDFGMVLVLLETVVTAVCNVLGTQPTAVAMGHQGAVSAKATTTAADMARLVEDKGLAMDTPLNRWKTFIAARRRQSTNVVGSRNVSRPQSANTSRSNIASNNCSSTSIGNTANNNFNISNNNNPRATAAGNPPYMDVTHNLGLTTAALAMLATFVNTTRFVDGHTPLHAAAAMGYGDIVDVLVKHNGDLGSRAVPTVSCVYVSGFGGEAADGTATCAAHSPTTATSTTFAVPLHALLGGSGIVASPAAISAGMCGGLLAAAAGGGVGGLASPTANPLAAKPAPQRRPSSGSSSVPTTPQPHGCSGDSPSPPQWAMLGVRPIEVAKHFRRADVVSRMTLYVVNGMRGGSLAARMALGLVDELSTRAPTANATGAGGNAGDAARAIAAIAVAGKSRRKEAICRQLAKGGEGLLGRDEASRREKQKGAFGMAGNSKRDANSKGAALLADIHQHPEVLLLARQLAGVYRFGATSSALPPPPPMPPNSGIAGGSSSANTAAVAPTNLAELFEHNRLRMKHRASIVGGGGGGGGNVTSANNTGDGVATMNRQPVAPIPSGGASTMSPIPALKRGSDSHSSAHAAFVPLRPTTMATATGGANNSNSRPAAASVDGIDRPPAMQQITTNHTAPMNNHANNTNNVNSTSSFPLPSPIIGAAATLNNNDATAAHYNNDTSAATGGFGSTSGAPLQHMMMMMGASTSLSSYGGSLGMHPNPPAGGNGSGGVGLLGASQQPSAVGPTVTAAGTGRRLSLDARLTNGYRGGGGGSDVSGGAIGGGAALIANSSVGAILSTQIYHPLPRQPHPSHGGNLSPAAGEARGEETGGGGATVSLPASPSPATLLVPLRATPHGMGH